jgi:hypothetical protein
LHGNQGGQRVLMIRRGDEHGVYLSAEFIEHLPVIREYLNLGAVHAFVGHQFANGVMPVLIHVDYGDEFLVERRSDVRHRAATAANLGNANLLTEHAARRRGATGKHAGARESCLFQEGPTSKLSLHVSWKSVQRICLIKWLSDAGVVAQQKF